MNLLLLAPNIQEEVLDSTPRLASQHGISEREMRQITRIADWSQQKRLWDRLSW